MEQASPNTQPDSTPASGLKRCPRCERILPTTEFYRDSNASDGLHWICKDCQRQRAHRYYEANKDKIREQVVRYRTNNEEAYRQAGKAYNRRRYQADPEAASAAAQKWRAENPHYLTEWRSRNRERLQRQDRDRARARYASDPTYRERAIARVDARRAKKRGLGSDLLVLDFLIQRDLGICQLCGKQITEDRGSMGPSPDHIIPLSKDGLHAYENLQLAHLACNHRKNAKLA
jgi:5-methylcytosine-specific restriction endonuclease McrA